MTHLEMIEEAHRLICEYVYRQDVYPETMQEIVDIIKQAREKFDEEESYESH